MPSTKLQQRRERHEAATLAVLEAVGEYIYLAERDRIDAREAYDRMRTAWAAYNGEAKASYDTD